MSFVRVIGKLRDDVSRERCRLMHSRLLEISMVVSTHAEGEWRCTAFSVVRIHLRLQDEDGIPNRRKFSQPLLQVEPFELRRLRREHEVVKARLETRARSRLRGCCMQGDW